MSLLINRTLPAGVNPECVAPASDGRVIALVETPCTLSVWNARNYDEGPLRLQGHRKPITAICMGSLANPRLVCSAARDFIIVWNVEKVRFMIQQGGESRGEIIGTGFGEVSVVVFDNKDSLVAAAVHSDVYLLRSDAHKVVAKLEGRGGRVYAASFCPHYSATLVTTSEDRSFQVWDVESFHLVYESPIIASTPLICIAMNPMKAHVLLGTTDGILKVYDLTDGNNFRNLSQIDLPKLFRKFIETRESMKPTRESMPPGPVVVSGKRAKWQTPGYFEGGGEEVASSVLEEQAILALAFLQTAQEQSGQGGSAMEDVLSESPPQLLVCSTQHLAQINSQSLEVIDLLELGQPVLVQGCSALQPLLTAGLRYACLGASSTPTLPGCTACVPLVLCTQFHNTVFLAQWSLPPCKGQSALESSMAAMALGGGDSSMDGEGRDDILSIVATRPLCDSSPLRKELVPKARDSQGKGGGKGGGRKKLDPMNQPLTFKASVKSSGYSQAPRTSRFQPHINKPRQQPEKTFNPSATFNAGRPGGVREYQAGGGPPCTLMHSLALGPAPMAVTSLQYVGSGTALACGLMDGTAQVWRLAGPRPPSSAPLVGHNAPVESVAWSHSGQWLVTGSQDRSALVWARDSGEPVLKVDSLAHNLTGCTAEAKSMQSGGEEAMKEVRKAQFFYMDRFLLLVAGASLCLYKYYLDTGKDEIKRYLTRSRYKLAGRWTTASQTLTAMAAVNSFYSHLVLTAGSNRSLCMFDLNEGRLAHEIPDAHPRPAHALVLSEGSGLALHSALAHNVFLSAAAGDCIKLWDLRSRQCAQRYQGHLNKAHACQLALSPCSQYLASGSEDRQVYIFDTRSGTYCQRLRGHSDIVTAVAFSPSRPQLASAGLDGRLLVFGPE